MKNKLSGDEIGKIYEMIKRYHSKYLKKYDVKLPVLINKLGNYTKDALVLVYLAQDYPGTKKVTKGELTQFIRVFYPDVADVQQAKAPWCPEGVVYCSRWKG